MGEDDTPAFLVAPDGKAYYEPHWHSKDVVDFDKLEAGLAVPVVDEQTRPRVNSGQAHIFSPLEPQQCQTKSTDTRIRVSLPRSPSLKKLSANLFDAEN